MNFPKLCYVILCLCLISSVDLQDTSEEENNENEIESKRPRAQSAEDTRDREDTRDIEDTTDSTDREITRDRQDRRDIEDATDSRDREVTRDRQDRRDIEDTTDSRDREITRDRQDRRDIEDTKDSRDREVTRDRQDRTDIDNTRDTERRKKKDGQGEENDLVDEPLEEPIHEQLRELELTCPDSDIRGQIIGGQASSIRRHPYQVSMVINGNSFCGGFIISRNYVLTAAHCVRGATANRLRLRVGSTRRDVGGRIVPIANISVHPLYGNPMFDNDIAALRLARPLRWRRNIRPIRLPQTNQRVPLVRLTVTGWGLTAPRGRRIPRVMMEARVPVVPHWICRLSYGNTLTNNMFCGGHFLIGGVSSCQGDSGGPAAFRGTAYGVVSFARGCALPLSPTVFTNLAAVRPWITQTTGV